MAETIDSKPMAKEVKTDEGKDRPKRRRIGIVQSQPRDDGDQATPQVNGNGVTLRELGGGWMPDPRPALALAQALRKRG
jgi:hypothetical protein